jgi:hypothetical protein
MRWLFLLFLFVTLLSGCSENESYLFNPNNNSFTQKNITETNTPTVFCFLSPTCPLCIKQTNTLQKLINKYNSKISFYIIIPSNQLPEITITQSCALFSLHCPIYIDKHSRFSKQKGASTTPQSIRTSKKYTMGDSTTHSRLLTHLAFRIYQYLNNAIINRCTINNTGWVFYRIGLFKRISSFHNKLFPSKFCCCVYC